LTFQLEPAADFIPNRDDRAWNLSVLRLPGACTEWVSLLKVSEDPEALS